MKRSYVAGGGSALCLAVTVVLGACGVTEVAVAPLDPAGVWQSTVDGVSETTLDFSADGSFERFSVAFSSETCTRESGTWRVDGARLSIGLDMRDGTPISVTESYDGAVEGGVLSLDAWGLAASFRSVSRMVDCVTYGWGAWTGRVAANVDGVDRTFDDLEVDLDVDAGTLRLTGHWRPCPACPREVPELILELGGSPGALEPATYSVQNAAGAQRTLFGFYHPDPGNPDFEGFSTERLSPPGEFVLVAIADERISGTFSFRGNPRSDGDVAPDGRTFTLLTEGVVDLAYR